MKLSKSLSSGILASVLALGGGLAVGTTPAQAATWSCSSLTNGAFCIRWASDGYDVQYMKSKGDQVVLDFNLWCKNGKKFGNKGSFVASSGSTHSYVFQVGSQGKCQGVLRAGKNGSVIASTPYLTR